MQDYPKLLLQASKEMEVNRTCLVVTFPRFMAWSPVKNDYQRAAMLKAKTGFEESPRSGEADILALFRKQLLTLNECVECNPQKEPRIVIEDGAYVCLWPEAGVCTEELHRHIGGSRCIVLCWTGRKKTVWIIVKETRSNLGSMNPIKAINTPAIGFVTIASMG